MKQYDPLLLISIVLLASFVFPFSTTQAAMQKKVRIDRITNNNYGSIAVIDGKIILGDLLQQKLHEKIITAKNELQHLSKNSEISYSKTISIGYFHLGQDRWEIKFTFGGIILDISETIILSTEQIFALKKFFQYTDSLIINGHKYRTSRSMSQFGPILHQKKI